ncbi:Hsp70 family protein [Salsipaludibacter albus]|uniref:Hsp70 family protein n=1 Tax=Salsipaludibacter albus TaxID=2849650 RepID=UPI001EE46364|nr:Hsp70 family protein [Salsipaludibacter albus]MBY5164118.1 Hsp70 family protein [Salsipaludibacter albus]
MGHWQLAIDFGTTNTAAAILRDGVAVPLRLSTSGDQMPSGVLARPDGSLLVGEAAHNEAAMHLESFEPNPKYRLGEEAIYLAERDWSPVELVRAVLVRVRETAQRTSGGVTQTSVVLTHPAAWEQHLRDRLRDAALLAGFTDVKLISEPIAAARWYAARHRDDGSNGHGVIEQGSTIGVFDFGGGTCDVAVLRATDDRAEEFEVLASGGDSYLGGEEIDRVLMEWALDAALEDVGAETRGRIEQDRGGRDWFTFRDLVRRAKHTLSEADSAGIPISFAEVSRSLRITRTEFDDLVSPQMDRAMDLTREVFAAAETTPEHLATLPGDAVGMYLTGGSATIPVVQERMHALLDRSPARLDDPKTVVPRGALIAPRVEADRPTATVQPPTSGGPSRVRMEVDHRRQVEQEARGPGADGIPDRVAGLEREIFRLRAALDEREARLARQAAPAVAPAPTPAPLPPARTTRPSPRVAPPSSPTATAAPRAAPATPRRRGVWRVLFGLLFGGLGAMLAYVGTFGGYQAWVNGADDEFSFAIGTTIVGLVLLLVARRLLRRPRGARR